MASGQLPVSGEAHGADVSVASSTASVSGETHGAVAFFASPTASVSGEAHGKDASIASPAASVAGAEAMSMAKSDANDGAASDVIAAASRTAAETSSGAVDEADSQGADQQSAADHEQHGVDNPSVVGDVPGSEPHQHCKPHGYDVVSQPTCVAIPDASNGIPGVLIRKCDHGHIELDEEGSRSATEAGASTLAGSQQHDPQHSPSAAGLQTSPPSSRHSVAGGSEDVASPAARDPQSSAAERYDSSAAVLQQQRGSWDSQAAKSLHDSCLCWGVALAAASQQSRSHSDPGQHGQAAAPSPPQLAEVSAAEAAATATPAGTAAAAVGAQVVVEQEAAVQSRNQALQAAAAEAVATNQQGHGELGQALQRQAFADQASLAVAAGCASGDSTYAMPYHKDASFVLRNAPMLRAIPRFYGNVYSGDSMLLELEDVAQLYKRPSIIDIKIGFKTWYPGGGERYIEKCKVKDASTTQSKLGFKVCGMQVFRHLQRGFWRASKRWCKGMSEDAVTKALLRFANNEAGLTPKDIYGGPKGAIAQLAGLTAWFAQQTEFCFYSSSVLIIYEGAATTADSAAVSIRLVDFAHTFPSEGQPDGNFLAGARALLGALSGVLALDSYDI